MNDKKVIFWLHRVLAEKCEDIKKIQERISILNHQIQNFDKMQEEYQNDVIKDLVEDLIRCYDWQNAITELETEFGCEKPMTKKHPIGICIRCEKNKCCKIPEYKKLDMKWCAKFKDNKFGGEKK